MGAYWQTEGVGRQMHDEKDRQRNGKIKGGRDRERDEKADDGPR